MQSVTKISKLPLRFLAASSGRERLRVPFAIENGPGTRDARGVRAVGKFVTIERHYLFPRSIDLAEVRQMVFSDALADRIRAEFSRRAVDVRQQRMFGGLCFMVCDKMCVCILAEHLMVRLDPDDCDWALTQPGCRPMDLTGRPMKGFVLVEMDALDTQSQLEKWLDLALAYNPKAKLSKKRRTKEDV